MMHRYKNLWAELSSRSDVAPKGQVAADWREILLEYPDRFMIGTDTYTSERWKIIGSNAHRARKWLSELPVEVAESIAYRNGESVLTVEFSKRR
jgi:hypothetical protein